MSKIKKALTTATFSPLDFMICGLFIFIINVVIALFTNIQTNVELAVVLFAFGITSSIYEYFVNQRINNE